MINNLPAKVNIPGLKNESKLQFSGFAFMVINSQFVCETWAKNLIRFGWVLGDC